MLAPSIPVNFLYIRWAHSATAVSQNDYDHENGEVKKTNFTDWVTTEA